MSKIRNKRILVAYSMSSTYTPATLEYVLALKNFTDYEVDYVHVTHGARMNFDINSYDVLFQSYCARLCFDGYVSEHYQQALMGFRGLKILAVQDDYDRTATTHRAIRRLGFHVLLTCIQKEFWPLAYPAAEIPGVHVVQGLTGYVPESLLTRKFDYTPLQDRAILIGYRGRDIGAKYGQLGFEKYEIGRRMAEICDARGIRHDIAMDDSSRIYGDAWFDFLGSARTMLGAESGSNAFDFDGALERQIMAFTHERRRAPTYREFRPVLDPLEAYFDVGQISPRIFECATIRTPMILFRGRYSDAIQADQHYIPLEKDFSNVENVLAALHDIDRLQKVSENAYQRLVASGEFGHKSLAKLLEDTIEEQYPIWVDPQWVSYRAAMEKFWSARANRTSPQRESGTAHNAPREVPTEIAGVRVRFAEKQILVASGEAGHESVAKLPEATIVERDPMGFDPKSFSYRRASKKFWSTLANRAPPQGESGTAHDVLSEVPTKLPGTHDQFAEKQRQRDVPRLVWLARPRPVSHVGAFEAGARRLLRWGWQLLPAAVRYWMASLLLVPPRRR